MCSVQGCRQSVRTRGWCGMHYMRWRKHGDPTVVLKGGVRAATPELNRARFVDKVDWPEDAADCWNWTACVSTDGYPFFSLGRRNKKAYRVLYEWMVGPIPTGLQIDHLCRNRRCVNPLHLEPVTGGENSRRATGVRTHCREGHPLEGDNLIAHIFRKGGGRQCRTCANAYQRRRYAARRASL